VGGRRSTANFNFVDYQCLPSQGAAREGEVYYNYEKIPGTRVDELPGLSVFYKDESGDRTSPHYRRMRSGNEPALRTFYYLDLTPRGARDRNMVGCGDARKAEYANQRAPVVMRPAPELKSRVGL